MDKRWEEEAKAAKETEKWALHWCAQPPLLTSRMSPTMSRLPTPAPPTPPRPTKAQQLSHPLILSPPSLSPAPPLCREAQRHPNYWTDLRLIEARKKLPWEWRADWTDEEEQELVGMTNGQIEEVAFHTLKVGGDALGMERWGREAAAASGGGGTGKPRRGWGGESRLMLLMGVHSRTSSLLFHSHPCFYLTLTDPQPPHPPFPPRVQTGDPRFKVSYRDLRPVDLDEVDFLRSIGCDPHAGGA